MIFFIVFYKESWKKKNASGKSDITREEFVQWTRGIWDFSGEHKLKGIHPAPFPIELPYRCIKLFSYIEDVILDPFMGSGTILIASKNTERKAIGVEIDRNYCNIAYKRLFCNSLKVMEDIDAEYNISAAVHSNSKPEALYDNLDILIETVDKNKYL